MRIARYQADDREIVGIVIDDSVVDLATIAPERPDDVVSLLEAGPHAWKRVQAAAEDAEGRPLETVRLLAPVTRPGTFLAVGMNSADHAEEAQTAERTPALLELIRASEHLQAAFPAPKFPSVFNKQTTCIAGPSDEIWIPSDTPEVDYEGEAVIVIGRRVRRADEQRAAEAIAGWMITNDVSVRDWQWNTSQWWLGKSFDTHGPIGPWVVTADEFDAGSATIRTWVNGELRQDGRLADQILGPAKIVSVLSQVCTLEPGDLIATGTPSGIGSIHGIFLQRGDRVRVAVSGIGEIENEVVDEPVPAVAAVGSAAA